MRTFETQGDGKEREEEAALAARANRSDRDLGLFPLWPSLRTQLGHLPRSESGQLATFAVQQESHRIVSAAASITLIITGVAKTATCPLPTRGAVC